MSHVATVTVWRCGLWLDGWCHGTEYGCSDPLCAEAHALSAAEPCCTEWKPQEELSHRDFLSQFGRCPTGPRGCHVAVQLDALAEVAP